MRLEPQIETLYQTLNRELDNFPAGTKFYSVRKLMDKFKCHRGVLDEVLERLEANQLIDRIPQVGIFSSVTRRPNARKVLLVMPDWPGEVCREWRRKACAYADSHERWQLKEVIMPPDRNTIQFLSTENFDAAIIQMPSSNISREEMKFLAELSIPTVLLNVDTGSFSVSNVHSDDADGAIQACTYLYRHGHQKIAILQSEPHTRATEKLVAAFSHVAELFNMELTHIDCMTVSGEFAQHRAYLGMKRFLTEHDGQINFTAVYSLYGESAPGIMAALREFGCELPDDVSIMAHSTEQIGRFYHPALTAVCADIGAEVEAAFTGIAAILDRQKDYFKFEIPMKLIERDSVKNLTLP
ncbi:substrate-binding domain-containing protein [uncultured Victivallis sp.]|uniref:substrate-binding domain-containing protein n=1 Tax=uncultured Victivallis sp. TaxID=354118 RepID=UPI0025D68762|nr:substrate-binding domain-containing protein [uncultured Victivallis sp.]